MIGVIAVEVEGSEARSETLVCVSKNDSADSFDSVLNEAAPRDK